MKETTAIKLLEKEVNTKIMLILFTFKNGKIGDKPLGPIAITQLIYPNDILFAGSIIGKINELEKLGIVFSKQEKINRKNYRILYPNFRKFVDIFNEYYNLGLTEEEKDFLAKWFSEVDWSVLTAPVFEKMIREKLERNIIQMVGDTIKIFAETYINTGIDYVPINLEEIKYFKLITDFYKKITEIPPQIIEKLNKIEETLITKTIKSIVFSSVMFFKLISDKYGEQ